MKVVIADPLHKRVTEILQNAGLIVVDVSEKKEELEKELKDAHALIVRSATKVNKELLQKAPALKIVGRAGVGLDNIDLEATKKKGIEVVNSPEGPTVSVAEFTLGLMIAVARKFGIAYTGTKNGFWPKKQAKGIELKGKVLGIIGSGAIGGQLARYALALEMKVLAYDIVEYEHLKSLENFEYVTLDYLLQHSDFISLHVPLLPATKHMINSDAFEKMKDGVIIINAARGGVIDEHALLQSIKSGKVAGAALDVFEIEPPTNQELLQSPNVFVTPHIGANTLEAQEKNGTIVAEKIISFLQG